MVFVEPLLIGFTIYSKSGCHYCTKIKEILKEKNLFFIEVQCEEYLLEERENFLSFIEYKIGKSYTTFPMVFYDNKFLGGFNEASEYISKLIVSFDELF